MIRVIIIIFILLMIVIIVPFLIDNIFISSIETNSRTIEWLSFLGAYLGGILGGLATLVGVLLTLRYSIEIQKDKNRLSILPFIKIISTPNINQIKKLRNSESVGLPHIIIHKDKEFTEDKNSNSNKLKDEDKD